MGLIINNYKQSMMSQRTLSKQTDALSKFSERLSTAVKINHASDDAAGLMIAESLLNAYNGSLMASANIEDTVSMLQVAEGDMMSIKDNLSAIRDLSVRAASDAYGSAERAAINSEIQSRMDEIDRISSSSSYNGKKLLDGSSTELRVQIGSSSDDTLTLDASVLGNANLAALSILDETAALNTGEDYRGFINQIDSALAISGERLSAFGSINNRLESADLSLSVITGNILSSESRIRDADIANTMSQMVNTQILQQASVGVLSITNQAAKAYTQLI